MILNSASDMSENTIENKKGLILLVDDDSFLLNMYSIKFKAAGFEVEVALEGLAALVKLREGLKPIAVMIDMIMPNMDGIETLAQMRKENLAQEAKMIILSNQSEQTDIERAKALNVDGYIVKATTIPSEVVTEVEKILMKR
jgi:CheY-like chemotaxis protein